MIWPCQWQETANRAHSNLAGVCVMLYISSTFLWQYRHFILLHTMNFWWWMLCASVYVQTLTNASKCILHNDDISFIFIRGCVCEFLCTRDHSWPLQMWGARLFRNQNDSIIIAVGICQFPVHTYMTYVPVAVQISPNTSSIIHEPRENEWKTITKTEITAHAYRIHDCTTLRMTILWCEMSRVVWERKR